MFYLRLLIRLVVPKNAVIPACISSDSKWRVIFPGLCQKINKSLAKS
jgi:hypothetical protein